MLKQLKGYQNNKSVKLLSYQLPTFSYELNVFLVSKTDKATNLNVLFSSVLGETAGVLLFDNFCCSCLLFFRLLRELDSCIPPARIFSYNSYKTDITSNKTII